MTTARTQWALGPRAPGSRTRGLRAIGFAAFLALSLGGCAESERSASYEHVAKEWSKAIRASQVIPTYPLTQDLQPGDMFVVDVPIETEQELWDEKGYLPLGYHFGRLSIGQAEYAEFYDHDFGLTAGGRRPPALYRQLPATPATDNGAAPPPKPPKDASGDPSGDAPAADDASTDPAKAKPGATSNNSTSVDADKHKTAKAGAGGSDAPVEVPIPVEERTSRQSWDLAPFASFPSYSVDISQQGGFNVGLPVQGVPIALGFMGSTQATATVSLKEAYTYGIDNEEVWADLTKAYGAKAKYGQQLSDRLVKFGPRYARNADGTNTVRYRFLRVITRVYLLGAVDVSVNDHSSWAADLGFGTSGLKNNFDLIAKAGKNADDYKALLGVVNKGLIGKPADDTDTGTKKPADAKPADKTPAAKESKDGKAGAAAAGTAGTTSADAATPVAGGTSPAGTTPAKTDTTAKTDTLSDDAAGGIGGRVKVLSVSDKAITLREKFPRPLVVGYIAIDIPIGLDGRLSSRRADTFKRLSTMGHQSLGDVGEAIQDWMLFRADGFNAIEDWGIVNARWLSELGFDEFAGKDQQGTYHYVSGSLQGHFMKGKLARFAYRFVRPASYLSGKWSALYRRLENEIVYAPDGVMTDLLPKSREYAADNAAYDAVAKNLRGTTNPLSDALSPEDRAAYTELWEAADLKTNVAYQKDRRALFQSFSPTTEYELPTLSAPLK